ncbi:hypothetical protein GW915_06545 [bacterium]|nr:hypothetical protein [bacterium]
MKHIKLKGTPIEIGKAHGEEFRKDIKELYEIRRHLLDGFWKSLDRPQQEAFLNRQLTALERCTNLYEEFVALAQASSLTPQELMIVNNYTDMRDYSSTNAQEEGCSVFYVKNSKGTFTGQTWDMHASATPYVLHLEVERPNGLKLNIVTVTGCLALAGVSSKGQVSLINNMHCLESNPDGLMWPAAVRLMLEEDNCLSAKDTLEKNLPSSGHNYLISDINSGLNIETTGKRLEVTKSVQDKGYVFHTNHYVGSLKDAENLERQSKTTKARYKTLEELFSGDKWNSWSFEELNSKILLEEPSKTLCIPENPSSPHAASTCGGILVDLSSQRAEIFKGLYSENEKNCFDLA